MVVDPPPPVQEGEGGGGWWCGTDLKKSSATSAGTIAYGWEGHRLEIYTM